MGWRALCFLAVLVSGAAAQSPSEICGRIATTLRGGRAHLASSADPSGGNDDRGHYLRREGSRAVLMEADGPGIITRLWSANPAGTLRIYFDGEEKPRVELPFEQLGTPGGQLPREYGYCSAQGGGVSCWWPMAFAKHVRVEAEGVDQLYYQIDYTTLDASDGVPTFVPKPVPSFVAAPPPPPAALPGGRDLTLSPGAKAVLLSQSGGGAIDEIQLTPQPDTLAVLTSLRLQCTWDGAPGPSVDVPLADLLASGLGRQRRAGVVADWQPATGYRLLWHMPFARSATIALVNAGQRPVTVHGAASAGQGPGCREGYFCATGHASTTEAGRPHTLLDVTGQGKYVGTAVTLVGGEDLKFLEGDETFVVDGEDKLQGTGTEDYFDGAWFFRRGPFADPYAGAPTLLAGKSRVAAYRWHINDAIAFAKSLRATLEHGANNDAPGCRYRSVAYWYSATPYVSQPMPLAEPLPAFTEKGDGQRIIEAETLADKVQKPEGAEVAVADDADLPYQASGGKVLRFSLKGGQLLVLPLNLPNSGLWEVGRRGGQSPDLVIKPAGEGWVTEGRSADSLGYRRVEKGELALNLSGTVTDAIDYLWLREVGKTKDALEAESLKATCSGGQVQVATDLPKDVARSAALVGGAVPLEAVCSGGAGLRFAPGKPGDRCEIAFEVKEDGDYGLAAAWAQGPHQGTAKLLVDGQPAGEADCLADKPLVGARWGLGSRRLATGGHKLTLVANTSKPVQLDYLLLKPAQRGQEAECLVPLGDTAKTLVVKERFGAEPKWSGGAYAKVAAQPGRPVRFGVVAPRAGRYKVRLAEAKVPGGVAAAATLGGSPLGTLDSKGAGEALGKGIEAAVSLRGGLNELALTAKEPGALALDVVELTYVGRPRWHLAVAALAVLAALAGLARAVRRKGKQA